MKKILLAFAVFAFTQVNAQIVNNDFENWATDTIYFPGSSTIPADTFTANNPVGWTTSNSISGADSLGGVFFVTQSNSSYSGSYAVRMVTDTIHLPVIPGFPAVRITVPGFALNGKFPISTNSLLGAGTVITPAAIVGAGQPFTQRLNKIKGYYNYAPVFNTNTQANDTCMVWATLRKGSLTIADAIFKSNVTTGGNYQAFEATFKYYSCEMPDTLVVMFASSVPNVAAILGGNSGLQSGSVLLVDSVYYDGDMTNFNFQPLAHNDYDTTTLWLNKDVTVKVNDEDCGEAVTGFTLAVTTNPTHGTATPGGTNGFITYDPDGSYIGLDSFSYTLNDGTYTSAPAKVYVWVKDGNAIEDINTVPVSVYPVPASSSLNLVMDYSGKATLRIYDVVGKLVMTNTVSSTTTTLNVAELPNGTYGIQVLDEKGAVIARTKFAVSK